MRIDHTAFGEITIDGKTYEHDVIIRLSGKVVKRKKKLSKKCYGTSHVISKDEAKFIFEKGCERLIVGSGQMGNVTLSPEAEAYFSKKGCKVYCSQPPRRSACSIHREPGRQGFFPLRAEFPMKAEAALEVQVECEPSHLEEKPKRFRLNRRDVEIVENLDQWRAPPRSFM